MNTDENRWALASEYPASSLSGEGDAHFAKLVAAGSRGRLSIVTMPDAQLGYRSRDQLRAVSEGSVAMADSFGGALGEDEPLFGLSALPFIVADAGQARALYDEARPAYEALFARHRQKLLYSSPWPATGLWSKSPVRSAADVAALSIRAYDGTGARLFASLGARSCAVSFAELGPRLAAGEIDAVLSSGDGGAGPKLWGHLTRFTEITYAIPLSFATVNLDKWKALDGGTRAAVESAALATEARQWRALEGRKEENYARMREHGMTLEVAPRELRARLREAARSAASEWSARAGPEGAALLARGVEVRVS